MYTTLVRNKDILDKLEQSEIEILKSRIFHTPFDELTVFEDSKNILGKAGTHSILNNNITLNYFENRTTSFSEEGR